MTPSGRSNGDGIVAGSRPFSRADDARAWKSLWLSLAIAATGLLLPAILPGSWPALLAGAVPFGTGVLRLYSIQHDCGHYSYFTSRRRNDFVGNCLSIFSGIAHSVLRYNHNRHHAHLGDLFYRDDHEIFTMTVTEYLEAPRIRKLAYRIYRHPATLFLIGPIWVYFIRYRWPRNAAKVAPWDVLAQNAAMFAFWAAVALLLGWWSFYAILLGSFLAGSFGIFVVYVGHNFENTYWTQSEDRNFREAALTGSSYLDLGVVVDFVLLNFGYHDLHHLNVKVPCYNLKSCHRAMSGDLAHARIGFREAGTCLTWRLWDEASFRMVRFPQTLVGEVAS